MIKKKVGLVLGCGGARGMAHIAAIEYISALKIKPDFVAGSSIGSLIGALYCAGKLDDFKKDFFKLTKAQFLKYFYPAFSKSGLLDADKIIDYLYKYIPVDLRFEDLNIPLAIVATDYDTGNAVVFKKGNILKAVRASISIPAVFIPIRYSGRLLVDGGISDPLPIDVVKGMGAEVVIAVSLQPSVVMKKELRSKEPKDAPGSSTQRISFIPPKYFEMIRSNNYVNAGSKLFSKWLENKTKKSTKSLPNMLEIAIQSIQILMSQNTKMMIERYDPEVLIEPNLLHVPNLNVYARDASFEEGMQACRKMKKELLRLKKIIG